MSIRVLDASTLTTGTPAEQQAFCEALVDGFSSQGMVKIINHGISDMNIKKIFGWSKRFFKLEESIKQSIAHPPRANPNRGWVCAGQEKSTAITDFEKGVTNGGMNVFDLKESFDTGATDDPLYNNVWPPADSIPGFKEFMEHFYSMCQELHITILTALERGFLSRGIEVDLLTPCADNVSEMRLNYYPPIDIREIKSGLKTRISPHTDFGTITLLFQDSVGGLEVEDQASPGTYLPVPSNSPSEILVNIGDSLQRITNDVLTSVSHRVTVPIGEKDKEAGFLAERYSVAYFAKVGRATSLKPMRQFVPQGTKEKYPDMTAFEWNQIKLQKIYG